MDLKLLQKKLREFATERHWGQFHTPKNLSTALMVEAAELAELFQWKTPEESRAARMEPEMRTRIGEEAADVLLYLLQLADLTGVDLEYAIEDKLAKNATKHPLPDAIAPENIKSLQTHVLVDWENVLPTDMDIRALVPDVTHVWIFHGPNQKRIFEKQKSFGDALTLVPISRSGKNALDFHLSYYVGYISSRNPNARFVVIANDQGYGPMLEHAKELGFVVSQVGFGTSRVLAKKVPTEKTGSQNPPAKKAVAAKKIATAKKVGQSSPKSPSVSAENLTKTPVAKKAAPSKKAAKSKAVAPVAPTAKASKATQPTKKGPAAKELVPKALATSDSAATEKTVSGGRRPPIVDEEKAYAHVLASLRKSKNKPARKARLYGAVKSLLGARKPDDLAVERVVKRLKMDGHLEIDANETVVKTP